MGCAGSKETDLTEHPLRHKFDGVWEIDNDRGKPPQEVTNWSCIVRAFCQKDPVVERGTILVERLALQWEWSGPGGGGKGLSDLTHEDFEARVFSRKNTRGPFHGAKDTECKTQVTMDGQKTMVVVMTSSQGAETTLFLKQTEGQEAAPGT